MKTNPSRNEVVSGGDEILNAYLRSISGYAVLSPIEERRCAKKAAQGDLEARKRLVQSNLKLVVKIAKKTIHISGLPIIDLIQEGNIGLMVAVEKFNYKLGYKFGTYAAWWIKQAMFKAISEQSYAMKIPVYIQETLSKFSKIKSELEQKYNCNVKNCEVAQKMNISTDKIDTFLNAYTKALSIEGTYEINQGREVCLSDIIEDERQNVWADVEYDALKNDLNYALSSLKEREAQVLTLRFGLKEGVRKTLEEIGLMYGVTKECIRQTESRALAKIRNSNAAVELLSCYMI